MIKIGVVGFGLRAGGIYKILKEVDPEFCLGGIVDRMKKGFGRNFRRMNAMWIFTAISPDLPDGEKWMRC